MDQTQNKQFVCSGCGQRFDNREGLQRHEKECASAQASQKQGGGSNPMTRGAGGGFTRES
jgi:hypothetical protein